MATIICSIFFTLLPSKDLVDLVEIISELLVLVLLPRFPAVLHLHPKLEGGLRHGFFLIIVFCPLLFRLKVPPMQTPLSLLKNCISEYTTEMVHEYHGMDEILYCFTTDVIMDLGKPFKPKATNTAQSNDYCIIKHQNM